MAEHTRFAVCINNAGYAASLEVRKLYEVISDPDAEKDEMIRVIDESGEDYLYSCGPLRSCAASRGGGTGGTARHGK